MTRWQTDAVRCTPTVAIYYTATDDGKFSAHLIFFLEPLEKTTKTTPAVAWTASVINWSSSSILSKLARSWEDGRNECCLLCVRPRSLAVDKQEADEGKGDAERRGNRSTYKRRRPRVTEVGKLQAPGWWRLTAFCTDFTQLYIYHRHRHRRRRRHRHQSRLLTFHAL